MATLDLVAPDISCAHCQHTIEDSLGRMAGVRQVTVSVPEQAVHIDYDAAAVDATALRAALVEAGYPPR